jgi:guanine deaminase
MVGSNFKSSCFLIKFLIMFILLNLNFIRKGKVLSEDAKYLSLAIKTAADNVRNNGGPFGAVIVTADGQIFTSGTRVTEQNDPTAHAEVSVIRKACKALNDFNLKGAILYSSCEPCPMCLGACLWSRVDKIIYAANRYDAADAGFDDADFYTKLALGNVAQELRLVNANEPFDVWNNKINKIEY